MPPAEPSLLQVIVLAVVLRGGAPWRARDRA